MLKTLRKALDEDRTKTYVVEVSPLGLVEMTRQNVTDGVREILTARCPTCDGEGVVRSAETVAIEVLRELRDVIERQPEPEAHLIRVNPRSPGSCCADDSGLLELEAEPGKHFLFEGGDALADRHLRGGRVGTREKIEARALPFQVGDEVLVSIEEPHMYNPTTPSPASTRYSSAYRRRRARRRAKAGADRKRRALGGDRVAGRWRYGAGGLGRGRCAPRVS